MDIRISPRKQDECVDEPLPRTKSIWIKISSDHPTSSLGIKHQRAPANSPHHSPHPAPKSTHTTPSHLFKRIFQGHANAHEKEESANSEKLRALAKTPHPEVVHQPRHRESAQNRSRPPE